MPGLSVRRHRAPTLALASSAADVPVSSCVAAPAGAAAHTPAAASVGSIRRVACAARSARHRRWRGGARRRSWRSSSASATRWCALSQTTDPAGCRRVRETATGNVRAARRGCALSHPARQSVDERTRSHARHAQEHVRPLRCRIAFSMSWKHASTSISRSRSRSADRCRLRRRSRSGPRASLSSASRKCKPRHTRGSCWRRRRCCCGPLRRCARAAEPCRRSCTHWLTGGGRRLSSSPAPAVRARTIPFAEALRACEHSAPPARQLLTAVCLGPFVRRLAGRATVQCV